MSIKNFITKHLGGSQSTNTIFSFWSPYARRSIEIDISKDSFFCQSLLNKDYESALNVIGQHSSFYDWLQNGSVNIFKVEGKKIILQNNGFNPGYNVEEFNLMYLAASATILWSHLYNDPGYRGELELGAKSNNELIKRFFRLIRFDIPDYNVAIEGSYEYIEQAA